MFPIQDEPEGLGMLRIEHQRAGSREVKFRGDSPVRRSQRSNPVYGREARTGVRLDRARALSTGVCEATQASARVAAALYREDDWHEPGAGDAVDWPLSSQRESRGRVYRRHRFAQRYTLADVELLAAVDEAHDTLSGPATRRILEREYQQYDKQEYAWLASISVSHLYNLRRHRGYRQRRLNYVKTKPTAVTIAERRRPDPQGRPGYLRIDTVHQGDQDGIKDLFHINAVDEVTQWQIVAATERISEAWYSRC